MYGMEGNSASLNSEVIMTLKKISDKINVYVTAEADLELRLKSKGDKGLADLLEFVKQELRSLRKLQASLEEGAGE